MSINWLDIIILLLIAATAVLGCINGIIKSATVLVGIGLGMFIAGKTYESTASWFYFITNENWAQVAGYAAVFLMVAVIIGIIGTILTKTVEKLEMRWLDRALGGIAFAIAASLLIANAMSTPNVMPITLFTETKVLMISWVRT